MALVYLYLIFCITAFAQPWSGIIDANRAIDWTTAGVNGGIAAHATQCGSTITAYSGTAATINTAISNCTAGQHVKLDTGTFTLSTCINFAGKSDVTLRGSGPLSTTLVFTGSGCGSAPSGGADIMIENASQINPTAPANVANWTAGYTKGATSITLSDKTNLAVGTPIVLDQLNDSNTDNGGLWVCSNGPDDTQPGTPYCATEGDSGLGRTETRSQAQVVVVTSISGGACPCTIGISPGLFMPNWESGKTPQAWWGDDYVYGVGIEDMTIEHDQSSAPFGIAFTQARDSWVKNVRDLFSGRAHVLGYGGTTRITVRDSFVYGTQAASSQSYGIETDLSSSWLVENNISQRVVSFHSLGEAAEGHVYAYNFSIDDYFCAFGGGTSDWMQASSYHHTAGITYILFEGNTGIGFTADAIHGTAHFMTGFRNRWRGYDPAGCSAAGKASQTVAVHVYAYNRYFNFLGNVLGDDQRPHTTYEGFATSASQAGPDANANVAVYMWNWSGNQEKFSSVDNDTKARTTSFRWGNWDTVNDAARFVSAEVPTGDSFYPNSEPASQTLPASLYLASQPTAWWGNPFGVTVAAWPPIGPDVSGGNIDSIEGAGGKAYKIPAQVCWENLNADTTFSGTSRTVTGASWSGGTATLTIGTNTVVYGDTVAVRSVDPAGYNGNFLLSGRAATTVSYKLESNPGTYVSGGSVRENAVWAFDSASCYQSISASTSPRFGGGRFSGRIQ